jgi:hypothetical protein
MQIHLYLIGVCLLCSLFFVKQRGWVNKCTPVFLSLLLLVESYCYWLKANKISNNIEYNVWMPVEFSFYTIIIIASLENTKLKKGFTIAVCIYYFVVILNYCFFSEIHKFSGSTYAISTLMLVFTSLYKMRQLIFKQDIRNPFQEPFFWLIIGLIAVHTSGIFQFSATDYLYKKHLSIYRALQKLNIYLTCFQYGCLLIYFYTKWRFQK